VLQDKAKNFFLFFDNQKIQSITLYDNNEPTVEI